MQKFKYFRIVYLLIVSVLLVALVTVSVLCKESMGNYKDSVKNFKRIVASYNKSSKAHMASVAEYKKKMIKFKEDFLKETYDNQEKEFILNNMASIGDVMEKAGYSGNLKKGEYSKKYKGYKVKIKFDYEKGTAERNGYKVTFGSGIYEYKKYKETKKYASCSTLGDLIFCDISYKKNKLKVTEKSYEPDDWMDFPKVIAHAGGAKREDDSNSIYTNSKEALLTNYQLGHRVIEFDFKITTDDNLAAAHDFTEQGLSNEEVNEKNWKGSKAYGDGNDEGYTTLLVTDILDQMMVYRDMYLVTDMKGDTATVGEEFKVLCKEAKKRDSKLLDRIIPQIYSTGMYDEVMKINDWESIIFSTYKDSKEKAYNTISFCKSKKNIDVVTASYDDKRYNETAIDMVHENKMLMFYHSVDDYSTMTSCRKKGVDGFYTNFLLPRDILLLESQK
ncbi:MAG: hypothetical protein K6D02_08440 [Lachnospiraceae bacterium]|nr:hypothetical protein [Lachnospiraceae bacterium]